MSWTAPDDVIDAWIGEDAPSDQDKLQLWIDRAERLVRRRVPDLQARVDADDTSTGNDLLDTTIDVVVSMVTRVFRNPDGIRQENETTGPFTTSRTYGGDAPGELTITDDELADLQQVDPGGAFTIGLTPTYSPYFEA